MPLQLYRVVLETIVTVDLSPPPLWDQKDTRICSEAADPGGLA